MTDAKKRFSEFIDEMLVNRPICKISYVLGMGIGVQIALDLIKKSPNLSGEELLKKVEETVSVIEKEMRSEILNKK